MANYLLKIQLDDIANQNEILLLRYIECPIDNMIPLKSCAVVCKKCETVYCKNCIDAWKKTSNICPMRCSPMELIEVENTIIANQLDKIKVKCNNEEHGCDKKIFIKDIESHKANCYFKQIECINCNEITNEGYLKEHMLKECKSLCINCFICDTKCQINEISNHIIECLENHYLCNICCGYHSKNESNNDKNCCLLLDKCNMCNMPDLKHNILNKIHICINTQQSKDKVTISNYLLKILYKIESLIEKKIKAKSVVFTSFEKRLKELTSLIETKYKNYLKLIDINMRKVEDSYNSKIKVKSKEINSNLIILDKSIEKANKKKENIFNLTNAKENILNANIINLKNEFELSKNKTLSRLNQLQMILFTISEDKSYICKSVILENNDSNKLIKSNSNSMLTDLSKNDNANNGNIKSNNNNNISNTNNLIYKKFEQNQNFSYSNINKTNNLKKSKLISCNNTNVISSNNSSETSGSISKNNTNNNSNLNNLSLNNIDKLFKKKENDLNNKEMSNILTKEINKIKSQLNNKEDEHKIIDTSNVKCKICSKPNSEKLNHKKCYYNKCYNYFCNECFTRNSFQARDSNVKCSYLSCDSCGLKKICVMSTLYCNKCSKRSCAGCFKNKHASHANLVFFE